MCDIKIFDIKKLNKCLIVLIRMSINMFFSYIYNNEFLTFSEI